MLTTSLVHPLSKVPNVATIKIELNDDNVLMLLVSYDEVCHVVDISNSSHFSYSTRTFTPHSFIVDVDKNPL